MEEQVGGMGSAGGNTVVMESRMSGAPDLPASGTLQVQIPDGCTLDGGAWHLTTDQHGAPTAQISPPAVPMFQQVVEYLEAKPVPAGGSVRRADEARAAVRRALSWMGWRSLVFRSPRSGRLVSGGTTCRRFHP